MVSIIITWHNRAELEQTLPAFIKCQEQLNCEIITVNYGGNRNDYNRILSSTTGVVSTVEVDQCTYFNKAKANNIGAFHASHPLLFFCDCDILLDSNVLLDLINNVQQSLRSFGTLAGIKETSINTREGGFVVCFGYELFIKTKQGRKVRIIDNEEDIQKGTRQAPGLLLCKRDDFLYINGYNSELDGWGWEDQDIICRLTLGAGLNRIIQGQAIHISHDELSRTQAYPITNRWESRDRMFRRALANYDKGNFSGTYQRDVSFLSRKSPDLIKGK
jgi:hypothetical protein